MVLIGKAALPKRGSMSHPFNASSVGNSKLNPPKATFPQASKPERSPGDGIPTASFDAAQYHRASKHFGNHVASDVYSNVTAEKEEICKDDDVPSASSSRGPSVLPVGKHMSTMLTDIEDMLRLSSLAANEGDENFRTIQSLLQAFVFEKQTSSSLLEQHHSKEEDVSTSQQPSSRDDDVDSCARPLREEVIENDEFGDTSPEDATRLIQEVATVFRSATCSVDELHQNATLIESNREASVSPPIDAGDL